MNTFAIYETPDARKNTFIHKSIVVSGDLHYMISMHSSSLSQYSYSSYLRK